MKKSKILTLITVICLFLINSLSVLADGNTPVGNRDGDTPVGNIVGYLYDALGDIIGYIFG